MPVIPAEDELHMLLMKRKEDNTAHSGQVSFPGGSFDDTDADLQATALREAEEEVGIASSAVDVLGALTPLYIPVSNFHVYPYVGYTDKRPEYNLSHNEVSYTIEVSLDALLHADRENSNGCSISRVAGCYKESKGISTGRRDDHMGCDRNDHQRIRGCFIRTWKRIILLILFPFFTDGA